MFYLASAAACGVQHCNDFDLISANAVNRNVWKAGHNQDAGPWHYARSARPWKIS